MNWRRLSLALLALGLAWLAGAGARWLGPAPSFGQVAIEGSFKPGGEYPGQPLPLSPAPRTWGSWSGSDENTGTLRLGPFPAPAQLRLAIAGYPHQRGGNSLYLEMQDIGFRWPLPVDEAREGWRIEDIDIPYGWRGRLVTLVAIDGSRELTGWLGVSEPLPRPGGRVIEHGAVASFAAAAANALLLGLGFIAAARGLSGLAGLPPHWVALAAGAALALAGYVAFWLYFWSPIAGRIFSWAILAAAVVGPALPAGRRFSPPASSGEEAGLKPARPLGAEWPAVLGLTAGIGLFYVALLHLFGVHRDFYDLAASRFFAPLPGDNRLPHDLAVLLYHGDSLKNFTGDWLSSDRPPLQAGWILLTWPITALLGFGATTASGTASVCFQLLWVAAVFGLLRTLGLETRRALAWCAVFACTGFCLQHSVFTWPKMAAGAFGCGAFAVWMLERDRPAPNFVLGGVFAALAWLSHGGVAFALLALVPFALWRMLRGEWRGWALAAAAFLLLALPWTAYQRFYDPPANRLLKWHLAGQAEIDPRGTLETMRARYAPLSWPEIVAAKWFNLRFQLHADWAALFDFSTAHAQQRRQDELNQTVRSLGWSLLGLAALGAAAFGAGPRHRLREHGRRQLALGLWLLVTIVVWCVLMFLPTAVIVLGSYTVMLGAFALLAAWADLAGRLGLALVATLHALAFATTWVISNGTIRGPIDRLAAVALAAAIVVLAGFFLRGLAAPPPARRSVT